MAHPPRPSWLYALVAVLSWPVAFLVLRLRSSGRENVPDGGCVLAANHWSNFDPWPLGIPLFPRRFLRFMAKKELFKNGFASWSLVSLGGFRVDRDRFDLVAVRRALAVLGRGDVLVNGGIHRS